MPELIAAVKLDIFTAIGAETASPDDPLATNQPRATNFMRLNLIVAATVFDESLVRGWVAEKKINDLRRSDKISDFIDGGLRSARRLI